MALQVFMPSIRRGSSVADFEERPAVLKQAVADGAGPEDADEEVVRRFAFTPGHILVDRNIQVDALMLALMLGVLAYSPARALIGLALMIGGVVLTGSSRSSTELLERSLKRAEQERNAAIDALGLAPIGGDPRD